MTQGTIERYHRSMKNLIRLQNYEFPWDLERWIARFVACYNHQRCHESFDNLTLACLLRESQGGALATGGDQTDAGGSAPSAHALAAGSRLTVEAELVRPNLQSRFISLLLTRYSFLPEGGQG